MATLREMTDRRANLARQVRQLVNSNSRCWDDRRHRQYEGSLAEIDRLDAAIAVTTRDEDRRKLEAAISAGRAKPTEAMFTDFLRGGGIKGAMSTTTNSEGGYTVPNDVSSRFVDRLADYSSVRRLAEVIVTPAGRSLPWPTTDGITETGEQLSENAIATGQDVTFGQVPFPTYRYSSKVIALPFELVQDASIDIEGLVVERLAARIGRITNTRFTTGTGSGQPQGFVTAATQGKVGTTGQTTTVTHDDLVDLVHSVNSAYRNDPNGGVSFAMSDTALKVVRKVKDSQNRPIYLPGSSTEAASLLGYPVDVNDDVPVPAANAKSILFGAFRTGYKVRDAMDIRVFRFDDSAYVSKGQIGFLAISRSGGQLVDTQAVKYYQHSAS